MHIYKSNFEKHIFLNLSWDEFGKENLRFLGSLTILKYISRPKFQ